MKFDLVYLIGALGGGVFIFWLLNVLNFLPKDDVFFAIFYFPGLFLLALSISLKGARQCEEDAGQIKK